MNGEKKVDKAAWKCSKAVDYTMRLLRLEFSEHLQVSLENNALCDLEDNKVFEWSAVHRFNFTLPALRLVFATPGNETAHPLHIERPAMSPAGVVQLDRKANVVRGKAGSGVQLFLEKSPYPMYGEGELSAPKATWWVQRRECCRRG